MLAFLVVGGCSLTVLPLLMVLVQPAGMVLYYSLIPTPSPPPVFVSTNMNLEDLRDFINVMSMDSSARGIILRSLLAMSGPKI